MTSKMKTYTVLYAEDVPHYAGGEIEARSDKKALAKARKFDTDELCAYDADWDNAVCRRIVSIEDEKGNVIAEDIALDNYVLHKGTAAQQRRVDAAEEMFRALKACRAVVHRHGQDHQMDLLDAALAKAQGKVMTEEIENDFGMKCPQCGASDEIDVCADVWVRLCRDGTDVTAAENGDTEWSDRSAAKCCACGFAGNVGDFSKARGQP